MKKRFFSFVLMLAFSLSMLPIEAFASENSAVLKEPTVIELTVTYEDALTEKTVSLLPLDGTQQVVIPADGELTFQVQFDSTERLDKVYITSTTDNGIKYMEAEPQSTGTYIATGCFDPADKSYIPGKIGVSYTKKLVAVTENSIVSSDIDIEKLNVQMIEQGISLQNIVTNDDGSVSARLVLGEMFGAMAEEYIDVSVSSFFSSNSIDESELNTWLGVYSDLAALNHNELKDADGKEYILYQDLGTVSNGTYLALVKDVSGNRYTKMLLSSSGLDSVSQAMGTVNTVAAMLYDYCAISEEMDVLHEMVDTDAVMNDAQKETAKEQIDLLEHDKKLFMLGTTAAAMMVGTVASAPALIFSALLSGVTAASGYFWEQRIGMIQGCAKIGGMISVSGGCGIPLTEEYLDENGRLIVDSGRYCLEETIGTIVVGSAYYDITVDAALCLHGHDIESSVNVGGDSTLRLSDCKYTESADGTVTGGRILGDHIGGVRNNGGTVTIDDCIIPGGIFNESGTVTVLGGCFDGRGAYVNAYSSALISNMQDGTVMIYGGIFRSDGYALYNEGNVSLSGAEIHSNGEIAVYNYEEAEMTISGSTTIIENTAGSCIKNAGKLILRNGTIASSGGDVISNEKTGTMTISGGLVCSDSDDGINYYCRGLVNDGKAFVTGGTIKAVEPIVNAGELSIINGTVEGISSNTWNAIGISNTGEGVLTISGGSIYSDCTGIACGGSEVTISGGKILAGASAVETEDHFVKLLIGGHSVIDITSELTPAFTGTPDLQAAEGYTGGVRYFTEENPEGVHTTLVEMGALLENFTEDYSYIIPNDFGIPSYLRLDGDLYESEPESVIIETDAAPQGSILILAAYHENGRMLWSKIAVAESPGEPLTFNYAGTPHELRLFTLDAITYVPLQKSQSIFN